MVTFEVNEALSMLEGLAGKNVRIRGLLSFEFENVALSHVAFAERKRGYSSSIWLELAGEPELLDSETFEKLSGKVVFVEGALLKPDPTFAGCGHMGLWPAELRARLIER